MNFRTAIQITPSALPLDYSSRILVLGSCFATSIGGRLAESKFSVCVNPTGVLFNPLSICSILERFDSCRKITESELEQGREGWFHYDFHSSLSDEQPSLALSKINAAIERGATALRDADTIIITLGTARVYTLKERGKVVASCHKRPPSCFERRAMSLDEMVEALSAQIERFSSTRFIFTVSPVRHLLDGLTQNSLSNATRRLAIEELTKRYERVEYFGAYEILLDDLRDYRFYADDMVHPSSVAVEYIWQRFCESYITESTKAQIKGVEQIMRAVAHRPFNPQSEAYAAFCAQQLEQIKLYPNIDFGKENAYFMSQLQKKL